MNYREIKFNKIIRQQGLAAVLAIVVIGLMLPNLAFASVVKVAPSTGNFRINQDVPVRIVLDTQRKKINAVSGEISVPANVNVKISDGNSIVSNWIEVPAVVKNVIKFAGIIPGGYIGSDGTILTLLLSSGQSRSASVRFATTPKALLHDGNGTEDAVSVIAGTLQFSQNGSVVEPVADNTPPEPFVLTIAKDQNLYNGQYVAVFGTQDKGSGIDHYEILEEKSYNKDKEERWQVATSPYLLKDQSRSSYVFVKAIDRAGNERIASVAPVSNLPLLQRLIGPMVLIIIALIVVTVWRIINHRRAHRVQKVSRSIKKSNAKN